MNDSKYDLLRDFRLPAYRELPNMGLYLEQTVVYINKCIAPLGCAPVTGSMLRNYVKMNMLSHPVNKQYFAEHIAHLLAVTILKTVLSLDQLKILFDRQHISYADETAYDYFCTEFRKAVRSSFGVEESAAESSGHGSHERLVLRSAIRSAAQIIYLNAVFREMCDAGNESETAD